MAATPRLETSGISSSLTRLSSVFHAERHSRGSGRSRGKGTFGASYRKRGEARVFPAAFCWGACAQGGLHDPEEDRSLRR